jgi:hypothetical protein
MQTLSTLRTVLCRSRKRILRDLLGQGIRREVAGGGAQAPLRGVDKTNLPTLIPIIPFHHSTPMRELVMIRVDNIFDIA